MQHIQHLRLKDWIHSLDGNTGSRLWHGEYIDTVDGIVIDKFSEREAHDFHGYSGFAVFEHFEEGEGGPAQKFPQMVSVFDGLVGFEKLEFSH